MEPPFGIQLRGQLVPDKVAYDSSVVRTDSQIRPKRKSAGAGPMRFPLPTWHRQRVCALHFPQLNRSSDTTHPLFSWSTSGPHWSDHGPKALLPGERRLDRAFYPVRWRAPGSDGVSISRIGHHAISSAISRWVCAFHPCGRPPSREIPCFSGDVHRCLDCVHCGPAFPKAELVFRETIVADHVTL